MSPSNSKCADANRNAPLVDIENGNGEKSNGDVLVDIDGSVDGLIEARGFDGVRPYNDWPNDIGVRLYHPYPRSREMLDVDLESQFDAVHEERTPANPRVN